MKKVKGVEYAVFTKGDKENLNSYHIFNQVYEVNYYLVIGQRNKMSTMFPYIKDDLGGEGGCFQTPNRGIIIWMKEKGNLDVFAHELIHAISETCNSRGIEYDRENDEHIAFLMSWLFRSFYFAVK